MCSRMIRSGRHSNYGSPQWWDSNVIPYSLLNQLMIPVYVCNCSHCFVKWSYHRALNVSTIVLTFPKISINLCYNIRSLLRHMSDQSRNCTGQHQKCLDVHMFCYNMYVCTYVCTYNYVHRYVYVYVCMHLCLVL